MLNNFNIKLLDKLIKIRSLSLDHKACLKVLTLLEKDVKKIGVPIKLGEINGFPFLIAGIPRTAKFLILSHTDVVDGAETQFHLKLKNDKLLGRGALDMKGPLVASLQAFKDLWQKGRRNILFVVTTDEEVGGFNGTKALAKRLNNIDLAFIPDSTSEENLVVCQKAPFHIKIFDNKGKSAHGSRPWESINSAEKISKCSLQIVQKINKDQSNKTSAAITQIHSGSAINTIPNKAFSTIDIRISRLKEVLQTISFIKKITKANNCLWEKIDEPLIFEMSPKNAFVRKWINSFQKVTGRKPKLVTESSASDARFLAKIGVPAIITSAIGGGAHSEKEWVSKKSLEQLSQVLFQFSLQI